MPKKTTDDFVFGTGVDYADKDELIEKKVEFTILSIKFEPGAGFEGADRWACEIQRADADEGATQILTFGTNQKRDEEMEAARAHMVLTGGPLRNITLSKHGRAYYFTSPK